MTVRGDYEATLVLNGPTGLHAANARRFVRKHLGSLVTPLRVLDIELVASELVKEAFTNGRTGPATLTVHTDQQFARIQVLCQRLGADRLTSGRAEILGRLTNTVVVGEQFGRLALTATIPLHGGRPADPL